MDDQASQRRFGRLVVAYVVTLGLIAVAVAVVAGVTRHSVEEAQDRLSPAQVASRSLAVAVTDQESGERGFVITADDRYLAPFMRGRDSASAALQRLRATLDDRAGRQRIDDVERRLRRWQAIAQAEIDATRANGPAAGAALVSAGQGNAEFDQLRAASRALDRLVEARVAAQRDDIRSATDALVLLLAVAAVAAAVLGLLSRRAFRRWGRARARAEAERQEQARGELRWNQGLTRLSVALSASGTDRDTSGSIAAEHLRGLFGARYVNVGSVDRLGVVNVHFDEHLTGSPLLAAFARTDSARRTIPITAAVHDGRPVVLADRRTIRSAYAEFARAVPADVQSLVVVPTTDVLGTVTGALSLAFAVELDAAFAGERAALIARVEAAAEVLSRHLMRVQWTYGADMLAGLARQLSDVSDADTVGRLVAADAWRTVDGALAATLLVDDDGTMRFSPPPEGDRSVPGPYDELHRAVAASLIDAVTAGEPVVLPDLEAVRARYPAPLDDTVEAGLRASVAVPVTVDGSVSGAISVGWGRPIVVDQALEARLATLAQIVGRAWERTRRVTAGAQTSAAVALYAAAVSLDDVAAVTVERAGVPLGATWSALAVFEDSDTSLCVHSGPGADGSVVALDDVSGHAEILSSTAPVWGDGAVLHELVPALRGATVATTVAVALRSHDEPIGMVVLGWDRRVDARADLVERLRSVAGACEQSLGRALLYASTARVASLAQHLATALSRSEVDAALRHWIPAITRAHTALFATLDEATAGAGPLARPAATTTGGGSGAGDGGGETSSTPLMDAMRAGAPVLIRDRRELRSRYPDLTLDDSATSLLAAPVRGSDGSVLAAVAAVWSAPMPAADPARALLSTIAGLTGQTLERIAVSASEHELTTRLADRITGAPPYISGMDIAVRYEPALSSLGLGGDWYQVIERQDGTVAVIVGDVVGHGVEAVADMAQLRTTLGNLVRLGVDVDEVFAVLHPLVENADPSVGTAMIGLIDRHRDELRVAVAGHPPPLVRSPGGRTRPLTTVTRHVLLGISTEVKAVDAVPFGPGSILVAYTDGLIERRSTSIDEGIAAIARIVDDSADGSADEIAEALLRHAAGADHRDDVAIVVVAC